jgi:hypothetical protein
MGVKLTWDADKQAYVPRRAGNVHEKAKTSPKEGKTNPNDALSRKAHKAYGTEHEAERPYKNYTVEQLFLENALQKMLSETPGVSNQHLRDAMEANPGCIRMRTIQAWLGT